MPLSLKKKKKNQLKIFLKRKKKGVLEMIKHSRTVFSIVKIMLLIYSFSLESAFYQGSQLISALERTKSLA